VCKVSDISAISAPCLSATLTASQAVKAEKKVLIGFRLGDLRADIFTYSKGKRAGEQGVSFKARLLHIGWIKMDGKLVYKAEPKAVETDTQETEAPASEPATSDVETQSAPTI